VRSAFSVGVTHEVQNHEVHHRVRYSAWRSGASEYYVVRGPDEKCKVVETKPTDKTMVIVGDKAYVTREEAEAQVKVVCKEKH
jgi:hypothetical protein